MIEALQNAAPKPARPVAMVAFTSEEVVRFAPDMMGNPVVAGGLPLQLSRLPRRLYL